jgi:hypothetical protein
LGLTGKRNCNWCALKDDQENSRPRQGSGYLPDGFYQTVSSMYWCYATDPPRSRFRHGDWYRFFSKSVTNLYLIAMTGLTGEEVRYIIDYYGAPPLPDVLPVFLLDARPMTLTAWQRSSDFQGWTCLEPAVAPTRSCHFHSPQYYLISQVFIWTVSLVFCSVCEQKTLMIGRNSAQMLDSFNYVRSCLLQYH